MKSLSNLAYFCIFLVLILIGPGYIYFRSHYIDFLGQCSIKIDGNFLQGNTQTIFKAIDKLRVEDDAAYKDVCKYVSIVSENDCPIDHEYGGAWIFNNQPGCFIKGSKIIYVTPNKENSSEVIAQRAEAIKRYSLLSKEYWTKGN